MAKLALVVVFFLGLVLSTQGEFTQFDGFAGSVLSSAEDEAESAKGSLFQMFSPDINKVTTEVKGAADTLSTSGTDAANIMKENAESWVDTFSPNATPGPSADNPKKSSWTGWITDRLRGIGLMPSNDSKKEANNLASTPAMAPGPAFAPIVFG
ncbi:uncharacterized protein LOC105773931 [Gossypium raimondii]|uniref:Pollen allergen Poa p IX/Phl p VI domain-containing protein n=1 Tax=Gossypium raimondii TaxID=29730 RepID=A0A0D2V3T2_GOSRA|nr:uncharacterized protein LOC105773931 [Gossypium raimondii]KJB63645.1 hypothetical protein B456_010G009800 [Gossypium raimondii]